VLSPVAGLEIHGADLRAPVESAVLRAIEAVFVRHHVLVFRDQSLAPEKQAAFSARFGELEDHVLRLPDGSRSPLVHRVTNLDPDGRPTARPPSFGNYCWHTDKSYHAVPSLATLLHAVALPPAGGDTEFANMQLAYDALAPEEREALSALRVIHSWEASRRNSGSKPATAEEIRERPPVEHPLVRTHPVSGRKSLYLGTHTSHVVGWPEERGRALLAELLERATRPELVYVHRWQPGDLVMWDNRALLHRARMNYEMARYPRILHRTVVRGTVPV
jgi:taurine dioxygenase